ncbi:MAG: GntR family transcriptional regulator [Oscillospiraceae bacterium]|nr:GntR family transcriptional regulator [Oscillospiraceae bacterium]
MFTIDLTSRTPIYEQIYFKIIELIIKGSLKENDQIPSVRNFAKDTGVNPNTVAKAYQELERNGIIYSLTGRGSFIAKIDNSLIKEFILSDFDSSVRKAITNGADSDELKERIDRISYDIKGEQYND